MAGAARIRTATAANAGARLFMWFQAYVPRNETSRLDLWKSCAWVVHILWTDCRRKFFSTRVRGKSSGAAGVDALSRRASLDHPANERKICCRFLTQLFSDTVATDVHRFRKSIAGQSYLIEATAVARDRWRAYIVRIPGAPTALMPFYGRTADEAATQLSDWLARAHQRAKSPAGTV